MVNLFNSFTDTDAEEKGDMGTSAGLFTFPKLTKKFHELWRLPEGGGDSGCHHPPVQTLVPGACASVGTGSVPLQTPRYLSIMSSILRCLRDGMMTTRVVLYRDMMVASRCFPSIMVKATIQYSSRRLTPM